MKKSVRILALLLSGLMLASGLVSCKKEEEKKGGEVNVDIPENEGPVLEVPAGIAEGKTFSVYIAHSSVNNNYIREEETGDDLNDSIYQRNALTEQHTGVELNFVGSTRPTDGASQGQETAQVRTLIQSGDDTYDAYINVQHSGMPTLIEEGMFIDWNEIPHVKLENPWWYANVQRDICFGNKIYCMTGDYNLASFSNTECLIFNKTMCDELELEYPYQAVFDGTWTHDMFVEYIKKATKDLNGDGKLDYDNDRYGFGGWQYEQLQALFAGYGGECLIKDEENLPVLNIDNELTYTVVDKMIEVFDNEGAFFEGKTFGIDDKMFNEGRLLFNDSFISSVPGTRSLENIDVGFVPYPKLDEDQEDYYSRTANISCLTYIPVTNQDLDKTGAVLETLAYYGNQLVLPTYFDIILTIKSTRDAESEEMIPIIRNSARFLDQVIGFNGSNIVTAKSGNTLASYIASNQDTWEEKIATLIETYQ
ncbi:MAG: extracellular solute-binding protein [Ruminococcaceae bacterium]|nr:extracellular solute-binding protein [Oscillospiraceae bacterium]